MEKLIGRRQSFLAASATGSAGEPHALMESSSVIQTKRPRCPMAARRSNSEAPGIAAPTLMAIPENGSGRNFVTVTIAA